MNYKKVFLLIIGCFGLIISCVFAQDQRVADSLARIYKQNIQVGTAKLDLLTELSFNESRNLEKGLKYAEELIALSKKNGDHRYLRRGYFLKGTKKRLLGKLDEALDAYFKSAGIARETGHIRGEGEAYGAIADIYSVANNFTNAFQYYHKSIHSLRQPRGDSISLASVFSNAGDAFLKIANYDSALYYFNQARIIFNKLNYLSGIGYSLGNLGMVYANIGKNEPAERNINEAIRILDETQDYYPICVYLISIGDIYSNKGDNKTALSYTIRSLQLAEQYGLKEQIAEASLKLSEIYERTGNINDAFRHYKTHILYRDSINNLNTVQRLADLRTNFEISQKQMEVDRANYEKRNLTIYFSIILILAILLLLTLYWFYKSKAKEKIRLHEQELLNARLEIQEQTYSNISQELHDNVGQALTLVKININTVELDKSDLAREKLTQSKDLLTKAIQDIRDISKTLSPDFINQIGLAKAIEQQLQLIERTGLYSTDLTLKGDVHDYEPQQELLIFRIVQELLNNTIEHAQGDAIFVSIIYEAEKLIIKVSDNGKGFDTNMQTVSSKGLGLRNIQNRLKWIKGAITFESEPKKGTTATIEILK